MSIRFDIDVTSIPMWFQFNFTSFESVSISLRFHFESTSISLRFHIDFRVNPLWVRFECIADSLGDHFVSTSISLWFHSESVSPVSLRFHCEVHSIWHRRLFEFTLRDPIPLRLHFDLTSMSYRFRSQSTLSSLRTRSGPTWSSRRIHFVVTSV